MAIRPAPMGQCTLKTRCQTGLNKGLAYDSEQPCEDGFTFVQTFCDCFPQQCNVECSEDQTITLTSSLALASKGEVVTTYFPAPGIEAGAAVRVVDGVIEVFNSCTGQFEFFANSPYQEGGDYDGQSINSALEKAQVSLCPDLANPVEEPPDNPEPGVPVTVNSFNGANWFFFQLTPDGTPQRTPVIVHPFVNSSIRFDISDPSNVGHPLGFYRDEAKTDRILQVLTEGTIGVDGFITIQNELALVPSGSRIYYDCLNHPGMGGDGYIEVI